MCLERKGKVVMIERKHEKANRCNYPCCLIACFYQTYVHGQEETQVNRHILLHFKLSTG